jgi:hypothetical protein
MAPLSANSKHGGNQRPSSPSGMHLGHYKALLARHEFSDLPDRDPRRAELEQKRDEILQLHFQMINYALENGYSYTRWQQIANAMLFKEQGNIKIHRTCDTSIRG